MNRWTCLQVTLVCVGLAMFGFTTNLHALDENTGFEKFVNCCSQADDGLPGTIEPYQCGSLMCTDSFDGTRSVGVFGSVGQACSAAGVNYFTVGFSEYHGGEVPGHGNRVIVNTSAAQALDSVSHEMLITKEPLSTKWVTTEVEFYVHANGPMDFSMCNAVDNPGACKDARGDNEHYVLASFVDFDDTVCDQCPGTDSHNKDQQFLAVIAGRFGDPDVSDPNSCGQKWLGKEGFVVEAAKQFGAPSCKDREVTLYPKTFIAHQIQPNTWYKLRLESGLNPATNTWGARYDVWIDANKDGVYSEGNYPSEGEYIGAGEIWGGETTSCGERLYVPEFADGPHGNGYVGMYGYWLRGGDDPSVWAHVDWDNLYVSEPLNPNEVGFWDEGFKEAIVRTDYDDPNLSQITLGLSPKDFACSIYTGKVTKFNASNSYTNAATWPLDNFWVISANNEPAYKDSDGTAPFESCNPGPPNQSLPIVDPLTSPDSGIMGLGVRTDKTIGENRAHFILNQSGLVPELTNPCWGEPGFPNGVAYLGLSAHRKRGNSGMPVGILNAKSPETPFRTTFIARLWEDTPGESVGDVRVQRDFYVTAESIWRGLKRVVILQLYEDNPDLLAGGKARIDWCWPVNESFYEPGADIAYRYAPILGLPTLPRAEEEKDLRYVIDWQQVFEAIDDDPEATWLDPMPRDLELPITLVGWAGEITGDGTRFHTSIHGMRMIAHEPIADAGPDQTVNAGQHVVLDGSASLDPDGDPLAYAWEQTDGPEPALIPAESGKERPSFIAGQAGLYVFRLIASDSEHNSEPDVVLVRIRETASITGTVTLYDTHGNPEANNGGVTVRLSGRSADGQWVRLRVLTEPKGAYTFEHVPAPVVGRPHKLRVSARGYRFTDLGAGSFKGNARSGRVSPPETGTAGIIGQVTDGASGLQGATVKLTGRTTLRNRVHLNVLTGPDGAYSLANLPAGTYKLIPRLSGRRFSAQEVTVGEGEVVQVDFN